MATMRNILIHKKKFAAFNAILNILCCKNRRKSCLENDSMVIYQFYKHFSSDDREGSILDGE